MIKINNKRLKLSLREDRINLAICIGISFLFWLLIKLSVTYSTDKQVNVSFLLPEGKTFRQAPPGDITANISGSGFDLLYSYFVNASIRVFYDLRGQGQLNRNRVQFRSDIANSLSPGSLEVTEVNYDQLNLYLEDKVQKKVPILSQADLQFFPDYHLQQPIQLTPDSVVVYGPISQINLIQHWLTDSIILKELKANVAEDIKLATPSPEINLGVQSTSLNITVEQLTEKSIFVPITVQNGPDSLKIFPPSIKLNFKVGLSEFESVGPHHFTAVINLNDIPLNSDKKTVAISIVKQPNFIQNLTYSPKSAEVFFIQ